MKRTLMMMLCVCLCAGMFAQEERVAPGEDIAPGLYYANGESWSPLTFVTGISSSSGVSLGGLIDIDQNSYSYKGATSDSYIAAGEFLLVIDPERRGATRTPRQYNPFIKTMSPELMVLIPLESGKRNRKYYEGRTINGFPTSLNYSIAFEYEQLSSTMWRILVQLPAGEYGWAFKIGAFGNYDLTAIFDFTVE